MRVPLYLLRESAIIEVFKGDAAYGPQYAQPVKVRCRTTPINQQKGLLRTRQGTEDVAIKLLAIFPPDTDITEKSKVTLNGRPFIVKDVSPQAGLVPSHIEAILAGL